MHLPYKAAEEINHFVLCMQKSFRTLLYWFMGAIWWIGTEVYIWLYSSQKSSQKNYLSIYQLFFQLDI